VRAIAPQVLGRPVAVPPADEYVARGAARQAAWALDGGETPPDWEIPGTTTYDAEPVPRVRERYAEAREATLDRVEAGER
jgi:xylulokinase